MEHSKIAIVIGTKAELIKTFPVMLELQKQGKDYWFIHTGQHALGKACEEFGVKKPDFIIRPEPKISTKYWSIIKLSTFLDCVRIMFNIRKLLIKLQPKYVIYHGDTMSTAMAAGASSTILNPFKKWKNVHLEAGLKSGSLLEPFPEEFTRQIVSRFTDLLFAVSDKAVENLDRRCNFVKNQIIKTGNTIIDSALITSKKSKNKYKKPSQEYFLINVHRYENLKNKKRLSQILNILEKTKIKGLWPLHDNTRKYLNKYGLMKKLQQLKNIEIDPLTNYANFIFLIKGCKYLIVDGGSIQEESLINLRRLN